MIIADDLGYSDVGFKGQRFYETSNIDALAHDGMILADFILATPIVHRHEPASTPACIPRDVNSTHPVEKQRAMLNRYDSLSQRKDKMI